MTFSPNTTAIRQHLEFIVSGMADYQDGKIEIAYGDENNIPRLADIFNPDDIKKIIEFVEGKNKAGRNIYLVGSHLDPDIAPFGRSSDTDFYASNVLWCDIDREIRPDELKTLYAVLPPSLIVITGRTPFMRTHLWWKLDEAITDADTMREALQGIQQALGGDPAVKNVTSLMRLGGTIAWPKKQGRTTEETEVIVPSNATKVTSIDAILNAYPAQEFSHNGIIVPHKEVKYESTGLIEVKINDGREQYMHEMLCATIINLTAELERWPTPQEVFDDAWPVYSRKVTAREGKTLDEEGRGQRLMVSKIKSKLSAFQRGKVRNLTSVEDIIRNNKKPQKKTVQQVIPETVYDADGVVMDPQEANILPFTMVCDIQPRIDGNDFIQGLLGEGQFSVIYGESNCGKTFFMTDLAFHVALGKRWRDRRVEQGGVVYLALEGSYGLSNRISAFVKENPEAKNMPFAVVSTHVNFFDESVNLDQFINTVTHVANQVGNVKLVVVDTLARAIAGGDENSGQDMGLLVKHADKLRLATGAHITFVHHSGKNKALGMRGHSNLLAAIDTTLEIDREEGAKYSTVKAKKQRDLEVGDPFYFGLKQVTLGVNKYNEEVKSCIVSIVEDVEETHQKDARLTEMQQFVYDCILDCMDRRGRELNTGDSGFLKCISYNELREVMEERGFKQMVDEDKAKTITNGVRIQLRGKNKIGFNKGYIWLLKQHD